MQAIIYVSRMLAIPSSFVLSAQQSASAFWSPDSHPICRVQDCVTDSFIICMKYANIEPCDCVFVEESRTF